MAKANVVVAGEAASSVTVIGPRAEVRRWAFAFGLSLGKDIYRLESAAPTPVYDTSNSVGSELVTVDGAYAGLLMIHQGDDWTATVLRKAMA